MRTLQRQKLTLVDGRQLRCRHWPGRGVPLVLLHGLLDSSAGWRALAQATHRPVYAIDLPGFDGSDQTLRPTLESYADDVLDALDALGLDTFIVGGHSLGGGIAALVAERSGAARCPGLVLMAPVGFGPLRMAEMFDSQSLRPVARHLLPLALLNPLAVTAAYSTLISNHRLPSPELLARLSRRSFEDAPGTVRAVRAIARAGQASDGLGKRQISYDGAVLALWGREDKLVPIVHLEALQRSLPRAKTIIWEGVGHHPQRERPQELARAIEWGCCLARTSLRAARCERSRLNVAA